MPSGWAAFSSANTAAISSAFLSPMSGFVLYLINVRFILFSVISLWPGIALRSQDVRPRPKDSGGTKEFLPGWTISGVQRNDAEVALHAERHAARVARIGEDPHHVVADLARRHRRAEPGEERL